VEERVVGHCRVRGRENAGLQGVRERACHPFGIRSDFPLFPARKCRAIECRRFRGWGLLLLFHCSTPEIKFSRTLTPPGNLVLVHTI